ncbi:hypothetical protein Cgig2_000986 [Carnegiea gigantea]|uniref:SWIM-type domain-containing protein n=1 Tax=Carnegiea gigantea TaxID=171969 RepID=A0A9Q1K3G4_9CARY|nr:hypothetical protein Cgig2_000986 [Carnegiea gigantea]
MGGMLAESGDEKVVYEAGSRKCIVVKEGMEVEEVMKMVKEIRGADMSEEKLWYSLKYDREMLVAVEGDNDVKIIFKGNDEHGYLYVARNGGPMRQARESVAICTGRVNCRSLGTEGGELPASRLRLGGDTIELSDDDEISIASEDTSDEETTKQDNASEEQSAEKGSVECYSLMFGEYSMELTDSRKLVVKLGQQTCTCRQGQMRGLPCCHALAVIAKANLWVVDECTYRVRDTQVRDVPHASVYRHPGAAQLD